MKAVTLGQPHATLVALGVQTILTTERPTEHRGPLAIHAARSPDGIYSLPGDCEGSDEGGWRYGYIGDYQALYCHRTSDEGTRGAAELHNVEHGVGVDLGTGVMLPLGAVVATAQLVDVVPIVPVAEPFRHDGKQRLFAGNSTLHRTNPAPTGGPALDLSDQLPYGDFTPGRYAFLLDDVKATEQRCPACWGSGDGESCPCVTQGLRYSGGLGPDHDGSPDECPDCYQGRRPCPTCDGSGVCPPIPAKGHQGLWTWEP